LGLSDASKSSIRFTSGFGEGLDMVGLTFSFWFTKVASGRFGRGEGIELEEVGLVEAAPSKPSNCGIGEDTFLTSGDLAATAGLALSAPLFTTSAFGRRRFGPFALPFVI
jgi:hypothetical protein